MHTAQTICISKQKSANFQVSKQQNLTLRPQDGTMFYTQDEKHKSQVREGLINSLHCGFSSMSSEGRPYQVSALWSSRKYNGVPQNQWDLTARCTVNNRHIFLQQDKGHLSSLLPKKNFSSQHTPNISMRLQRRLHKNTFKEILCQFQPNKNKHNKNDCSHTCKCHSKSNRPSLSSSMAVTTCHYSPLTGTTHSTGCRLVYNNLLKLWANNYIKIYILSFCHISGSNRKTQFW
jgi:hypothetical protein